MLGPFAIVARRRPVELVAEAFVALKADGPGAWDLPRPAPYAAATAVMSHAATLGLASGNAELTVRVRDGVLDLLVVGGGRTTEHRSRRYGRLAAPAEALAVTLTGTHLTGLVREGGRWRARARHDLRERLDTRAEAFCRGLRVHATGEVADVRAGAFGQLGLRDVRLVTGADGTPLSDDAGLWFTATHAGPGFFDAAHTGVWSIDPDGDPDGWVPHHRADLFFRRPDVPGVYGDNATHLVRDGDRWLVATSTWGDFDRVHKGASVAVALAKSEADLLHGQHVLDTEYLALPTTGLRSVGTWDPHLVRIGGRWHVGFVTASRFFRFLPALAVGDDLRHLELAAADSSRTATEGTTLVHVDDQWHVVASDGRRGPRGKRGRFPVFDLSLRETGRLDAPYPTNIPWPTLARLEDRWVMLTFNGTRAGGDLVGYGSHGDLVVMTT